MGYRLTLIAVAALLAGACRPADPAVTELIADSIVAHGEGRPNPAVEHEDVPELIRSLESGPVDRREDTLLDGGRILYEWNDRATRIALHRGGTVIPLRIEQAYSTLFPNREVGRLWTELSGSFVLAHWLGSDPTYITL